MPKKIEMVGRRFGRLVVIGNAKKCKGGYYKYKCVCDCGNEKSIYGHSLRSGTTRSCGCLKKEQLIEYNKKYASKRMKMNNPMSKPAILQKMIETKKMNGTLNATPSIRGGNGQETSFPQEVLAKALGWDMEVSIKTAPRNIKKGFRREYSTSNGWPSVYKIDIGNKDLKIAIEVDGSSHYGKRKIIDNKKEDFLKSLGWKVLRFRNKYVLENLDDCISIVMGGAK